jgi:DNA-binding beta-propeller fold protein YncE
LAGAAKGYGQTDGRPETARFTNPQGVAVDEAGAVYVADTNSRSIRMIAPNGLVTTLDCQPASRAGGGLDGFYPRSITTDRSGAIYVSDPANKCVRKIYRGIPEP